MKWKMGCVDSIDYIVSESRCLLSLLGKPIKQIEIASTSAQISLTISVPDIDIILL